MIYLQPSRRIEKQKRASEEDKEENRLGEFLKKARFGEGQRGCVGPVEPSSACGWDACGDNIMQRRAMEFVLYCRNRNGGYPLPSKAPAGIPSSLLSLHYFINNQRHAWSSTAKKGGNMEFKSILVRPSVATPGSR